MRQDSRHSGVLPRSAVLVVAEPDGFLTAYAEKNVDVRVVRVPHCPTPGGDRLAEEFLVAALPKRYRELYRADRQRASGIAAPLLPSTIAEAKQASAILKDLKTLADELKPASPTVIPTDGTEITEGQTTWTL